MTRYIVRRNFRRHDDTSPLKIRTFNTIIIMATKTNIRRDMLCDNRKIVIRVREIRCNKFGVLYD